MDKLVYPGLLIPDMNKIVMYNYWYAYVKPKYIEKAKLRQMDLDSFIVHLKSKDIYAYLAEDAKKRFDASNCGFINSARR